MEGTEDETGGGRKSTSTHTQMRGGDAAGRPHPIVGSGNGGVRTPPHSNVCGKTHTVENAKNGLNRGNT